MATQDIKKDEEILIGYRKELSNFDLFFYYGFIYQPNPFDEVKFNLKMVLGDPFFTHKLSFVEDLDQNFNLISNLNHHTVKKFIGFCRFIQLNRKEVSNVYSIDFKNKLLKQKKFELWWLNNGHLPYISIQNETSTWIYILKLIGKALNKYPTTLKEDL